MALPGNFFLDLCRQSFRKSRPGRFKGMEGVGHILAPMPEFLRKSAVFPRVRIPASRPNKHLQKPTCQELSLAVSERFARLRGTHVFRHVGFCWFSLGSSFGHKFAPMIGFSAGHVGPVPPRLPMQIRLVQPSRRDAPNRRSKLNGLAQLGDPTRLRLAYSLRLEEPMRRH